MQSVSTHAFEIGSMRREIEAVWSSYESFVEFFIDQVGIAPTIFHLVDWKRATPLKMPVKQVGDWHAGDPVHEHDGYLIMAHGNVVASPGNADVPTGVWTTVKPVNLEGFYSCVSRIGLGVTARLSLLIRPLGRNAAEVFKRTEKGPARQRVIKQFRVRVEAIALKEEAVEDGTAAVSGCLLAPNPATHIWSPMLEVNPHSSEVGWLRHGATRPVLAIGAETPAGSVARETSVNPARPGSEVDFKFFPKEVRELDEVRCFPLREIWEHYVPASEGKFFPLAGGLPLSEAAKLMYHAPKRAMLELVCAGIQGEEFMEAISGSIYPERPVDQPCDLVREGWCTWAPQVSTYILSMIWPVTAMEYAECEEPDCLGFVLTMLGYVNPSAAAGLCAEILSGCMPSKISYQGVEGSRVVVLVGQSHWITGSAGQSISEAKL